MRLVVNLSIKCFPYFANTANCSNRSFYSVVKRTVAAQHISKDKMNQTSVRESSNTEQDDSKDLYDIHGSDFAARLHELIQSERLLRGAKPGDKVVDFKHPQELKDTFPFDIKEEGSDNSELLAACSEIIRNSVKTTHPLFFNQLYYGGDPYGLAAAWLTEALNTNEHTFEVAPVFVLISEFIIRRLNALAGFDGGDGIFCPGGSMANMMGLALARYQQQNSVLEKGLFGQTRRVMFASEDCHYSYSKGAAFLGFGTESIISVKTDARGRMDMNDLQAKIQQEKENGNTPLAVLATTGTTVLGAYDDLNQAADICSEHRLWLHVDGCWGGGVLFSEKHKHLMAGIERTDSLCISLHKMMGAPLQCVPLLVKHKGLLQKCFGQKASYLFQQDKFYDVSYDLGDKTVQCGRKVDSMKFWLMWKARGDKGMAEHVDHAFENAAYFTQRLRDTAGFEVVLDEFQCLNIGFWYIPQRMRGKERTPEWWQELHHVAPKIKEKMQLEGSMLIGYQPLKSKGFVNFFRIILANARTTREHLDSVIATIDSYGQNL